jgi:hypothetical protein
MSHKNIAEIREVFENKDLIILEKKNAIKHGDTIVNLKIQDHTKKEVSKMDDHTEVNIEDVTALTVKAVINTTNIIDSHMDCHINGIWTKSVSETKLLYWLQEHNMNFKSIIADSVNENLKASVESVSWSSIGYNYPGTTEALMFESAISKSRNEFMFNQYKNGYVLNHSVGMRYVKLYLCVNSDDAEYSAEKDNWNKYYPVVVNKEVADDKGYFWAVTEAKAIEGSAVVKGSNQATPTISVETKNIEPLLDNTQNEDKEAANRTSTSEESKEEVNKLSITNFI